MRKLLFSVTPSDCDLQTFTVGGHGGSGKDTSNTGVRWVHRASGATGEAREQRSQIANKRAAWKRMAQSEAFQKWHRLEVARRSGERSIEELVDDARPGRALLGVRTECGGR